ncbi:exodeoxyribonuclease III [Nakamurella antarctica]|uniref:Exodeoxyribonuclease III n=1 Tax=Nakamurella antarctica TaxID=1902245 RepID=A0A3G8ZVX1_9ACTN|nr:exodeoxyribonuclease III [Nakamurella antarctica]AZI58604.1 exodeoxyribonuclease III [Nakamurella antarctica]
MLRVAAFNVNGLRAAVRRGFPVWAAARNADVICLQEVRAPLAAIPPEALAGYHLSYHEGNQPGRAGVAILSREEPSAVRIGFGDPEFDLQGRYIEVDLPGITVGSLYLPKGAADGDILASKLRFMAEFAQHTAKATRRAKRHKREFLVCGDYNIAHSELDIKSWKTNLKSAGFLPQERAWLGELIAAGGLVDVLRMLYPDVNGPYSWWSWRGQAFDNNSGWRIDHHLATPKLAKLAITGGVDRDPSYAERISDHAPVVVDYDL